MERAGVSIIWTDEKYLNPLAGKNHCKLGVIDGKSFITGINVHDWVLRSADYGLLFNDTELREIILEIILNKSDPENYSPRPELETFRGNDWELILENAVGEPNSEIINQAVRMIDSAQHEIFIATQFVPAPRVIEALMRAAERKVEVKLIVNDPGNFEFMTYRLGADWLRFKHYKCVSELGQRDAKKPS